MFGRSAPALRPGDRPPIASIDRLALDLARLAVCVNVVDQVAARVAARTATNDVGQRVVVGATVDVRFTDAAGVGHRLSRSTGRRDVLTGGLTVEVLYDPARPDDDRAVFLAFDRDPLPAEWIGAVA